MPNNNNLHKFIKILGIIFGGCNKTPWPDPDIAIGTGAIECRHVYWHQVAGGGSCGAHLNPVPIYTRSRIEHTRPII